MQPQSPPTPPLPPADPFRYGWRYVKRTLPNGEVELDQALCDVEGMMVGQRDHAGPELDALGALGGRRQSRFQDRIADIAAADLVLLRERAEIDVAGKRGQRRMHLHAPDLFAIVDLRHGEQDVRADPPLEGRIEIRGEIRCEDHDAVEPLELLQEHVHDGVAFALKSMVQ